MVLRAIRQMVPTSLKQTPDSPSYRQVEGAEPLTSAAFLSVLMQRYRVENLVNVKEREFRQEIDRFMKIDSANVVGAADPTIQRNLSQRFRWGHDHDFGSFQLAGAMGTRHLRHLAVFIDDFDALPRTLKDRRVLDVGCWTGGASLLLAAMGARVVAIDEVGMYADCLNYLAHAFDIRNLEAKSVSLYQCTEPSFQEAFDYVFFAGVLYHVTDPILALRIVFNALKDGGMCLVETTGIQSWRPIISYERRAWNWFDLSPPALHQMLGDVGFADAEIGNVTPDGRLYATAHRTCHIDMRRDGLSVRDIV